MKVPPMESPSSYYRSSAFLFFIMLMILSACTSTEKLKSEAEKEILELHNLQRKYHFEKMAPEFARQLSQQHISVNRGKITSPSQEENTQRFGAYFDSVTFEKWDDIQPPIIRFSDDYSMAYTVVNKEVIVKFKNDEGQTIRDRTEFSWVAIYKKGEKGWKIDCIGSTNLPSTSEVLPN